MGDILTFPDPVPKEIGIEEETRFIGLHFNSVARKLLAHFEREAPGIAAPSPVRSVYIRDIEGRSYRRLTPSTSNLSYDSLVTPTSQSLALINALRWSDGCGEWDHLAVADLKTEQLRPAFRPSDLKLPLRYRGGWVAELVGVDASGSLLDCRIAMHRTADLVVEYWLCQLDWRTGDIKRLTELRASSF